jgi:hypothetical protein
MSLPPAAPRAGASLAASLALLAALACTQSGCVGLAAQSGFLDPGHGARALAPHETELSGALTIGTAGISETNAAALRVEHQVSENISLGVDGGGVAAFSLIAPTSLGARAFSQFDLLPFLSLRLGAGVSGAFPIIGPPLPILGADVALFGTVPLGKANELFVGPVLSGAVVVVKGRPLFDANEVYGGAALGARFRLTEVVALSVTGALGAMRQATPGLAFTGVSGFVLPWSTLTARVSWQLE